MNGDTVRLPLHVLAGWWEAEQRATGEKILADAEAQLADAPGEVREAVLAEVERTLYHAHDLELAQLDRAVRDEIELRL